MIVVSCGPTYDIYSKVKLNYSSDEDKLGTHKGTVSLNAPEYESSVRTTSTAVKDVEI